MGCCNSECLAPQESTFECSYVTIKFTENEAPKSTPPTNKYPSKKLLATNISETGTPERTLTNKFASSKFLVETDTPKRNTLTNKFASSKFLVETDTPKRNTLTKKLGSSKYLATGTSNFHESNSSITESSQVSLSPSRRKPYKVHGPVDDYVLRGELMKYHPGISAQFISRWFVLTNTEFKYYKSRHSMSLCEKPLVVIPISSIDAVRQ